MCAGGKDGEKGVDGRIMWEFYERIFFGKICKAMRGWRRLRTASQQEADGWMGGGDVGTTYC